MSMPFVKEERVGQVAWLCLNRPDQRNPLSLAMIQALTSALESAYTNSSIRVIVISAEGPVFSAGHDLKEMERGADEGQEDFAGRIENILAHCAAMMTGIVRAPKPVIACVQGTATAAGCQLVSACDLAIAASDARFCTPGVNIGAFCTTPLVGIGRNLSRKHAMEMALTGDMFSAEDAVNFGLINRHVHLRICDLRPKRLRKKLHRDLPKAFAMARWPSTRRLKCPWTRPLLMPIVSCATH